MARLFGSRPPPSEDLFYETYYSLSQQYPLLLLLLLIVLGALLALLAVAWASGRVSRGPRGAGAEGGCCSESRGASWRGLPGASFLCRPTRGSSMAGTEKGDLARAVCHLPPHDPWIHKGNELSPGCCQLSSRRVFRLSVQWSAGSRIKPSSGFPAFPWVGGGWVGYVVS